VCAYFERGEVDLKSGVRDNKSDIEEPDRLLLDVARGARQNPGMKPLSNFVRHFWEVMSDPPRPVRPGGEHVTRLRQGSDVACV
jgi:hypothetical protein